MHFRRSPWTIYAGVIRWGGTPYWWATGALKKCDNQKGLYKSQQSAVLHNDPNGFRTSPSRGLLLFSLQGTGWLHQHIRISEEHNCMHTMRTQSDPSSSLNTIIRMPALVLLKGTGVQGWLKVHSPEHMSAWWTTSVFLRLNGGSGESNSSLTSTTSSAVDGTTLSRLLHINSSETIGGMPLTHLRISRQCHSYH